MNSIIEAQETFRDEIHKEIQRTILENMESSFKRSSKRFKLGILGVERITFTGFKLDRNIPV